MPKDLRLVSKSSHSTLIDSRNSSYTSSSDDDSEGSPKYLSEKKTPITQEFSGFERGADWSRNRRVVENAGVHRRLEKSSGTLSEYTNRSELCTPRKRARVEERRCVSDHVTKHRRFVTNSEPSSKLAQVNRVFDYFDVGHDDDDDTETSSDDSTEDECCNEVAYQQRREYISSSEDDERKRSHRSRRQRSKTCSNTSRSANKLSSNNSPYDHIRGEAHSSRSSPQFRTRNERDSSDNLHRRLSERFTSNSRFYARKTPIDSLYSPSDRSNRRKSIFTQEFKSNFYENLNSRQLDSARNVLQNEMTSDVPYVDTHCHIDFLFKRAFFQAGMNEYMDETFFKFPSNFEGCIADWCQPSLYSKARKILTTDTRQMKLWGAFGCHPHFVAEYSDSVEKEIEFHIDHYENVIAWGEMGLDYSDRFGRTDHDLQKSIFKRQLIQAVRRNLPLVIHCRDADQDLLPIMKRYVPHNAMIHRHCLTTEEKVVRPLLQHFPNCYVGFTNLLTNRKAFKPRDSVAKIPLNRIIIETDAPYFIPRCVTKESKGNAKWSHPGMASSVACEISDIKDISLDETLKRIRKNVKCLYGI